MSEKVVLPKFDLPGKQMHPAVKLLLGAGGMLVLAIGILVAAVWRNHSMEVAEENRKQAEIAAKTAEANAEIERAKLHQKELDTQVALAKAKVEAEAAAKKNAAAGGDAKVATAGSSSTGRRHGHHASAKAGGKTTVAKAGAPGDDKKPAAKGGGKKGDDVVDKLLASFK